MHRSIRVLFLALAALLAMPAQATVVAKLSTEQLTQRAHRVVRGTVKSAKASWTADHRRIVTRVELEVAESFKGQGTVSIVIPGGEVDGVGAYPSGYPRMAPGEELIVFLEKSPLDGFVPVSMSAAVYRVVRDHGKALVRRNLEGLSFAVMPKNGPMRIEEPPKPLENLGTLDEVRAAIVRGLSR